MKGEWTRSLYSRHPLSPLLDCFGQRVMRALAVRCDDGFADPGGALQTAINR